MKTFEEKFTAWIDGELKGNELTQFEAELAGVEDAELDRVLAHQLGDVLREHGRAPALQNVDFFSNQIMQRIHAEMPEPARKPERPRFVWSLPKLAFAGAFVLAGAFGIFHFMTPAPQVAQRNQVAQIYKTQSGDPDISATAFYSQKNDATVLWIDWKNQPVTKHNAAQEKHGAMQEKHNALQEKTE